MQVNNLLTRIKRESSGCSFWKFSQNLTKFCWSSNAYLLLFFSEYNKFWTSLFRGVNLRLPPSSILLLPRKCLPTSATLETPIRCNSDILFTTPGSILSLTLATCQNRNLWIVQNCNIRKISKINTWPPSGWLCVLLSGKMAKYSSTAAVCPFSSNNNCFSRVIVLCFLA